MNLYSYAIRTMAQSDSIDKRLQAINEKVHAVINLLDDLLEDPLFLDNIHGEQELSLDLALEMLDRIATQFEPQVVVETKYPLAVDDSYDAE